MARTPKPSDSPATPNAAGTDPAPAPTTATPAADKPKGVNVNAKRHKLVKTCGFLWGVSVEAALSRIIDEWQTANADSLSAALTAHLGE